jgi:2-methylcitrate dehydratase PrpD
MAHIADDLAAFAADTRFEDIPDEIVAQTKLLLLDSVGLAISSMGEPYVRSFVSIAESWYAPGECSIIGVGEGYSAPAAGLVNGVLIHGQDFDDTHPESLMHASSSVAASAFALAEEYGLSGEELLRLSAVGYEVMVRVGLGASPGAQMHQRGFQGTAIAAAVTAGTMAAVAAGLDHQRARHAVALTTSVASGLIESVRDGSFAKGLQPGWAVQAGMWAARTAAEGITGPTAAFEGKLGLYAAFAGLDNVDVGRVNRELGTKWESSTLEFKLYPFCHFLQGHVDSALSIREEAGIESFADIAEAAATLTDEEASRMCEPLEERLSPTSAYSLRFNLFYSVAMGLAGRAFNFEDFQWAFETEAVNAFARKVTFETFTTPLFPAQMPGSLRVTTTDGAVFERTFASTPGPFGRPVEAADVIAKFERLVEPELGASRTAQIVAAIQGLENEADARFLRLSLPLAATT